jgi:hypothetical protein
MMSSNFATTIPVMLQKCLSNFAAFAVTDRGRRANYRDLARKGDQSDPWRWRKLNR